MRHLRGFRFFINIFAGKGLFYIIFLLVFLHSPEKMNIFFNEIRRGHFEMSPAVFLFVHECLRKGKVHFFIDSERFLIKE
ncbi:MAG: hypothetical protein A2163_00635 [Actinobacteria bacterium RBG_13_35_12]|nr:MAG: hypothetical protein A2163_00635 [Actinobacteria bacterium RBG_13_35_12]